MNWNWLKRLQHNRALTKDHPVKTDWLNDYLTAHTYVNAIGETVTSVSCQDPEVANRPIDKPDQ